MTPRLTCSEKHVSLLLSKANHSVCAPGPSPFPSPKSICSCLLLLASGSLQCHPISPLLRSLCFSSVRVSAVLSASLTPYPISNLCRCISPQHASLLPVDSLPLQDLAYTILTSLKKRPWSSQKTTLYSVVPWHVVF